MNSKQIEEARTFQILICQSQIILPMEVKTDIVI